MKELAKNPFYLALPAWVRLLQMISKRQTTTLTNLSIGAGITYSHTFKVVDNMEKQGWVKYTEASNKRIKPIEITKRGKIISERCDSLLKELQNGA